MRNNIFIWSKTNHVDLITLGFILCLIPHVPFKVRTQSAG